MKRKALLTLAIGGILTLGSMGSAFAAEAVDTAANTTFARGNGLRLYTSAASVEDLLDQKLALIDKIVADGKITTEEGENYKKVISERMGDCTTIGENRDSNERLGIGFGSGSYLGQGQGLRTGSGFRGARGMGFGRIAAE